MAELNFKQELTSVFGQPVAENPTQAMIEAAYRHHNLDWRYLTIEVAPEDLPAAVQGMRAMNFRGGNLTIPHKVAVIPLLDGLSEAASLMGAVNCIVRDGDKLIGENTDGKGFVESLRGVTDPSGKRVVILGAGGAARAIAVELALAGASNFTIVNRSASRGESLVELLNTKVRELADVHAEFVNWEGDYDIPEGTDIVINATSIGLFPDVDARIALNTTTLSPNMVVADVIPNPPETRLVRDARKAGCHVLDGLGMLVNQGVIGFKLWTGVDPDAGVMRKALEDVFGA
ncbi:shikimate dehydrogenase [Rubinisphaera italica]|uniref:Shikimate dehydrogenase (NADP(+)) n=1 Tax=Rubinisphaera italica TaxID=2527969 RepID=A0A5C5XJN5_9PLAN|nr:shikimate dehydrogenase [Rubinisphaera italica]TWT62325.1 Shikimate dehydrogenase [Rubinisphaera italica]